MKNKRQIIILITIFVLFITSLNAQITIDLSGMTSNITLGNNCSSSQQQSYYQTTGDLNLNGKTLYLRNTTLKVNGNINGSGEIKSCGNSSICYTLSIQNNPEFDDVTAVNCNTLSIKDFKLIYPNLECKIYDISGKLLHTGLVKDDYIYPLDQILIIKTNQGTFKILKE